MSVSLHKLPAVTCDCNEDEYLPCEAHADVLAQREGASCRTGDELLLVFLDDALGIDAGCLSPYGLDVQARAEAALYAEDATSRRLEDEDLRDELSEVARQVEAYLDAVVVWEDGYVIYRLTGGPLLEA